MGKTATIEPGQTLALEHKPEGEYRTGTYHRTTWQWEIRGQYGELTGIGSHRPCRQCSQQILGGECAVRRVGAGIQGWAHLRCEPAATEGTHHAWTEAAKRAALDMIRAHKAVSLAKATEAPGFHFEPSPMLEFPIALCRQGESNLKARGYLHDHVSNATLKLLMKDGGDTLVERRLFELTDVGEALASAVHKMAS